MSLKIEIKNKRAKFEFEFLETFTAGLQLFGTEIKSIRNNKASIAEAYGIMVNGELFIRNMYIADYENGSHYNHNNKRDRKLLLKKDELKKLDKKSKNKGITIVPVKLFINEKGWAKINIALGKGKKIHDKREDLKNKDAQREIDRKLKNFK
tara:strand:- start:5438 stop:5893 length:456 start_codon:yes stop_codon:yes gene_type:complete